MSRMNGKMTFGVIVSTRGFFNPDLASGARKAPLEKLQNLGHEYVIPPENATPNGAAHLQDREREFFKRSRLLLRGCAASLRDYRAHGSAPSEPVQPLSRAFATARSSCKQRG